MMLCDTLKDAVYALTNPHMEVWTPLKIPEDVDLVGLESKVEGLAISSLGRMKQADKLLTFRLQNEVLVCENNDAVSAVLAKYDLTYILYTSFFNIVFSPHVAVDANCVQFKKFTPHDNPYRLNNLKVTSTEMSRREYIAACESYIEAYTSQSSTSVPLEDSTGERMYNIIPPDSPEAEELMKEALASIPVESDEPISAAKTKTKRGNKGKGKERFKPYRVDTPDTKADTKSSTVEEPESNTEPDVEPVPDPSNLFLAVAGSDSVQPCDNSVVAAQETRIDVDEDELRRRRLARARESRIRAASKGSNVSPEELNKLAEEEKALEQELKKSKSKGSTSTLKGIDLSKRTMQQPVIQPTLVKRSEPDTTKSAESVVGSKSETFADVFDDKAKTATLEVAMESVIFNRLGEVQSDDETAPEEKHETVVSEERQEAVTVAEEKPTDEQKSVEPVEEQKPVAEQETTEEQKLVVLEATSEIKQEDTSSTTAELTKSESEEKPSESTELSAPVESTKLEGSQGELKAALYEQLKLPTPVERPGLIIPYKGRNLIPADRINTGVPIDFRATGKRVDDKPVEAHHVWTKDESESDLKELHHIAPEPVVEESKAVESGFEESHCSDPENVIALPRDEHKRVTFAGQSGSIDAQADIEEQECPVADVATAVQDSWAGVAPNEVVATDDAPRIYKPSKDKLGISRLCISGFNVEPTYNTIADFILVAGHSPIENLQDFMENSKDYAICWVDLKQIQDTSKSLRKYLADLIVQHSDRKISSMLKLSLLCKQSGWVDGRIYFAHKIQNIHDTGLEGVINGVLNLMTSYPTYTTSMREQAVWGNSNALFTFYFDSLPLCTISGMGILNGLLKYIASCKYLHRCEFERVKFAKVGNTYTTVRELIVFIDDYLVDEGCRVYVKPIYSAECFVMMSSTLNEYRDWLRPMSEIFTEKTVPKYLRSTAKNPAGLFKFDVYDPVTKEVICTFNSVATVTAYMGSAEAVTKALLGELDSGLGLKLHCCKEGF